jgi:hypothetical protein
MAVRAAVSRLPRARSANALTQNGLSPDLAVPALLGTNVAAMHHMNQRIRRLYPIVAGLLAAVAVPAADASGLLWRVVIWIGDSHIIEVVVAANALTIVP